MTWSIQIFLIHFSNWMNETSEITELVFLTFFNFCNHKLVFHNPKSWIKKKKRYPIRSDGSDVLGMVIELRVWHLYINLACLSVCTSKPSNTRTFSVTPVPLSGRPALIGHAIRTSRKLLYAIWTKMGADKVLTRLFSEVLTKFAHWKLG